MKLDGIIDGFLMANLPSDLDVTRYLYSATGRPSVNALPTRDYLDATVIPVLMEGLSELARVRPANPVEYLAAYLFRNNPQREPKTIEV